MFEEKDHADRENNLGITYCIYSMPGGDVLNTSESGEAAATAPKARTTMQSMDSRL